MNANKALWEKGNFARIAETMRGTGEDLVGSLGVTPGLRVLDVGSGDGTTAVPAAQLGAEVLAVDISSPLLAAGRARAQRLGLANLTFQEGDACDLNGIEADGFDLVVSFFGAMFAPRPFDVARALVRVARPGGRIVMGNWIPGEPTFVAQLLRISAAFSPPPPEGFVSPVTWGVEANVVERFIAAGVPQDRIAFQRDTWMIDFPGPPSDLLAVFRAYYPPTMGAYEAAAADGREAELQAQLEQHFDEQNTSATATLIPAPFLRVTVRR